jgi:hypothetical protein
VIWIDWTYDPFEVTTKFAENWVTFCGAGVGKLVTQAKIDEKSTTVIASKMIVATTSETPRLALPRDLHRRPKVRPAERSRDARMEGLYCIGQGLRT